MPAAPTLAGDAAAAVAHRGSHLQIIASAGSGKTEVVAQRVADLLATGTRAEEIVAFTFTERAAASLKERIVARACERIGDQALDTIGRLFVGTIHAYCFRLLQEHVPQYETYDVLDDNQLVGFLTRESNRLEIKSLDSKQRLFASVRAFLENIDVVENELLDVDDLDEPFRGVTERFYAGLDTYRLLTHGQQIVRAVGALSDADVRAKVHGRLRHLIVDEYQDVNPAQERLIELLTGPHTNLCVVGDDDQAIYQWRGSDVSNIVTFADRYPDVAQYHLTTNYRSRPTIVSAANAFAETIPGRLPKQMQPSREAGSREVLVWHAETEADEARYVAEAVERMHSTGVAYRDIAVLVRGRASYPRLLEAFERRDIPVQPGGRTGLFERPEAVVLGKTYAWLVDHDWRIGFGGSETVGPEALVAEYGRVFGLTAARRRKVRERLDAWKSAVHDSARRVDLVRDFYALLEDLDCRSWDHDDPLVINTLGTLARFTTLLADYESVRRRARPDGDVPGEQVGGQDRGLWYYKWLAIQISNYASGAYEGFDVEPDVDVDAVDMTTIHKAKGLEWPVVFVPCLTNKGRFPSSRMGRPRSWLIPRRLFDAARYEGCDADERRLFYVAITRARDWLSLSRHEAVTRNRVALSPYYEDMLGYETDDNLPLPCVEPAGDDELPPVSLTFSELSAYDACGLSYRLRSLLGFQPTLAPELGYGNAVHHVLRTVAERTRDTGEVPGQMELDEILDDQFFLPAANKAAHREMKEAARRIVHSYATQHADDLRRVWETERPFELHLDRITISGRADVILDNEGGVVTSMAIVDYKTSTNGDGEHDLQLQVYADAGRREGMDVRAAYVHDLKGRRRDPVDVSAAGVGAAEATVVEIVSRLRQRDFSPRPSAACATCDVRALCRHG